QQREGGRKLGVGFAEGLVRVVVPAAVVSLAFLEGFEEFAAPVVFLAGGVGEAVFAPGVQGFAEGVVIVVETGLLHAGVFFQRVVSPHPVDSRLDAWIVLAYAGVEEAL